MTRSPRTNMSQTLAMPTDNAAQSRRSGNSAIERRQHPRSKGDAIRDPVWVPLAMRIVIAGAHGQIARRLGRILDDTDHRVMGIVRNPMLGPDRANAGIDAVVLDLAAA